MVQFQKKSDATAVCLILDTTNKENSEYVYQGQGYNHPKREREKPEGMDSYPTIFSYPGVR